MTLAAPWVLWLIAAMVFILSTRNPIYLLIMIAALYVLGTKLNDNKSNRQWFKLNLRFLLTIVGLSSLINALFAHSGKSVLFNLPESWLLIGGAITLESLVYGAVNGLVIGALYLLFNLFNKALSVKQITRLIPRAFHPLATMVTISLTFFPSIRQRIQEIREAQLIRGNPMKKVTDWLPILIPLLVSSLEDAFLLSESMTSRGFQTPTHKNNSSLTLVLLILSAFALFAGWILSLYSYPKSISYGLYIFAALVVLFTLIAGGRNNPVKPYKKELWQTADIIGTIIFFIMLITNLILLFSKNMPSFSYSPYPEMTLPPLQWLGVILSLMPGVPGLLQSHD
jgi:energy-coupling factor transporter transmembrane protein EcfT